LVHARALDLEGIRTLAVVFRIKVDARSWRDAVHENGNEALALEFKSALKGRSAEAVVGQRVGGAGTVTSWLEAGKLVNSRDGKQIDVQPWIDPPICKSVGEDVGRLVVELAVELVVRLNMVGAVGAMVGVVAFPAGAMVGVVVFPAGAMVGVVVFPAGAMVGVVVMPAGAMVGNVVGIVVAGVVGAMVGLLDSNSTFTSSRE
jgi:hypothetical protein